MTEAPGYLKVEAAAAAEGALHFGDILACRMRISIITRTGASTAPGRWPRWSRLCSWTAADIDREVANHMARVEAEVLSQAHDVSWTC